MGWKPGWHLNSNGRRQAEQLAHRMAQFPIRAIYTSPLERAVETAEPIANRLKVPLHRSNELGEVQFGEWEGRTIRELDESEEWRRYNAFRSGVRVPGGELMIETQARMMNKLECLSRQHEDQSIALVSHADPIRAVLALFMGIPMDFMLRFEISPGSVSVVETGAWAPRILCVNGAGDLAL